MSKQKGQIIIILLLVMVVALAIGLSIVQKSLIDISTSSKVEQSSRAFSAAEAGIEKMLKGDASCEGASCLSFTDNNSKISKLVDAGLKPPYPAANQRQDALEIPDLAKEQVEQVWLANFNSPNNPPDKVYTRPTLDVYWGSDSTDKPAIELTLVYYIETTHKYLSQKWFIDPVTSPTRAPNNGFEGISCSGGFKNYLCKKTLNFNSDQAAWPILLRMRLLYNKNKQPIAVQAENCGAALGCAIPPQDKEIYAIGSSGETQRRVKVYQKNVMVIPFFDYAIFSAGQIKK